MTFQKRHMNLALALGATSAMHLTTIPSEDVEKLMRPDELHAIHGPGRRTKSKLKAISKPFKKKKRKLQKRARRFTRQHAKFRNQ